MRTFNNHNRQTSVPPVGFEHTTSTGERQRTYALDRAATRTESVEAEVLEMKERDMKFQFCNLEPPLFVFIDRCIKWLPKKCWGVSELNVPGNIHTLAGGGDYAVVENA